MSAHAINDKDARKLAKVMEKRGFRFEEGRKHVTVFAPDGAQVGTLSQSPGTPRWELAKLRTLMRRWKINP